MEDRAAASASAVGGGANADPPPEVPLVVNPMYAPGRDGGALPTEVPLIVNVLYAGGGGPPTTATTTAVGDTYAGYAPPETAFRMAPTANATDAAANQSIPIIYAVPTEEGSRAAKKKCTRPTPTGGTCKNNALPAGGQFCTLHACPECDAGKSGPALGCPAHMTRPRKQSVYAGFDEGDDAEV